MSIMSKNGFNHRGSVRSSNSENHADQEHDTAKSISKKRETPRSEQFCISSLHFGYG